MRVFLLFTLALMWLPAASGEEKKPDFSGFDSWLAEFREKAVSEGISPATVERALSDIEPDPRVIRFDRRQPEFVQTFDQYLEARVTQTRIDLARQHLREHGDLLDRIADRYDVDPNFIIAFWGLESHFGKYQGKYSVVRSLATLAYDPRRSKFFTSQLLDALRILEQGHVEPDSFVGGWAGAMGQNQFIPSSFLRFAQDFDGDGRKNIWTSQADVFASIAFYLAENGWKRDAGWGAKVPLPEGLDVAALKNEKPPRGCRAYRHHTVRMTPAEWAAKGVVPDKSLNPETRYAMLLPAEGETSSWLVGANFRGILGYNCANKYAVSVGLLADKAVGGD